MQGRVALRFIEGKKQNVRRSRREPHDRTLLGFEITPCYDLVSVPVADRNP
jgi:hypothetical protein